jgi:hypothetical protein
MKCEPNRLMFRIPWVAEAAAEGPVALVVLLLLCLAALAFLGIVASLNWVA